MLSRIEKTAKKHGMFPEGCIVLCGVSGGADSMAMLCALFELREKLLIKEIVCAHLNHCLRGEESERDEAFVAKFCNSRGIRLILSKADVKIAAADSGEGIEQAARRLRYAFFEKAAKDTGAQVIATAHTADDNAETVLLNLSRGAGITGLSGIPPVRGNIVRPLIEVSRADVLKYLKSISQGYVEDSTNEDTAYYRNLIRRKVLPVLKNRNPALLGCVSSMTGLLRRDADFINLSAREAYDKTASAVPEGVAVSLDEFSGLHPSIMAQVCRMAYEQAGGIPGALSSVHSEKLLELAGSKRPSGRFCLPGGMTARRVYGRLIFEKNKENAGEFEPFWLKDGLEKDITACGLHISAKKADKNEIINNSFNTFHIKHDIIISGVLIRPRQEGDRFRLPGRGVSKSLKKLFIEAKIPAAMRDFIPVLEYEGEIIAVPGFGLGERYRAASPDEALIVKFRPLK